MRNHLNFILFLTLFAFTGAIATADAPAGGAQSYDVQNEADIFADEDDDEEDPFEFNKGDSDLSQDDSSEVEKAKEPRLFNRASKEVIEKANQIFGNPDYRQALQDAIRLVEENPGVFFPYENKETGTTLWHPIEWALSTGRNRRLTDDEVKIYRQIQDEAANAAYEQANKTSDPQLRLAKQDDVRRTYPGSSIAPAIALELGDALAKQSAALIAMDYWFSSIRPEITEHKQRKHWEYTYPSEKTRVSEAELVARLLIVEFQSRIPYIVLKKASGEITDIEAFKRLFPKDKGIVNASKIVFDTIEKPTYSLDGVDTEVLGRINTEEISVTNNKYKKISHVDNKSYSYYSLPESMVQYEGKEVVLADYLAQLSDEINKERELYRRHRSSASHFVKTSLSCNQFGLYDASPIESNGTVYSGKYLYYHVYNAKEQDCLQRLPLTVHPSNGLIAFIQGDLYYGNSVQEEESVLYSGRVPQDFTPKSNWLVCIDRDNENKVLWTRAWKSGRSFWNYSGIFIEDKFYALEFCKNNSPHSDENLKAVYLHCLEAKTGKTIYRTQVQSNCSYKNNSNYPWRTYRYFDNGVEISFFEYIMDREFQRQNFASMFIIRSNSYVRIIDGKPLYYVTKTSDDESDDDIPRGVF